MKLKNKKTGEIVSLDGELLFDNKVMLLKHYNSLSELNEEFEDYEEPKEYWYINSDSAIYATDCGKYPDSDLLREEIGNYFETKEEAEKAVRKLKAWKRLKEAGFVFCGTDCINQNNVIYFEFGEKPLNQSEADEAERDLEICFGGEE